MIIRSQDKKSITDDLKLHISECDFAKDNITYRIYTSTHDWLGTYSTEEKAIKVLDMICNTYVETVWTDSQMIIANRVCFEMPSDEEVEVQHEKEN